jgi:ketosteroid isomerase-like protein
MKTDMKFYVAAILLGLCVGVAQGQSALQEMVKTEQAFSKTAEEKNIRDAFLAFIADDGLLFRPGAVNGKKWMLEHPVPPSDKKPSLAWQPAYAGVSASGDMGFTTGPWEAKADVNDEKPQGYGHFVTVWKKQADGSWKFVVDLGISHPQSGGPQSLWTPADTNKKETFKPVDVTSARKSLLDRDQAYAVAATLGVANAFTEFASPDVRLYRANSLPFIGRDASLEALKKTAGKVEWHPLAADVSRAGDLGYTHGTYEAGTERGSYVRIWKKENGQWRIVMDVTNVH